MNLKILTMLLLTPLSLSIAQQGQQSQGTGFAVNRTGNILTCAHVVTDPDKTFVVTSDNQVYKAQVVHMDKQRDLAVLRVNFPITKVLSFSESSKVNLLDEIVVCGFPLASTIGMEMSVSKGNINSKRVDVDGTGLLQIDAAVNSGNSGGPVISTETSSVVGIAFFKLDPQKMMEQTGSSSERVNFAIPSDTAMQYLRERGVAFTVRNAGRLTPQRMGEVEAATFMILSDVSGDDENVQTGQMFSGDSVNQARAEEFSKIYLMVSASNNAEKTSAFFAENARYFNKGNLSRTAIRNELSRYNQDWPKRQFSLVSVDDFFEDKNGARITFTYSYTSTPKSGVPVTGKASVAITISAIETNSPVITEIRDGESGSWR